MEDPAKVRADAQKDKDTAALGLELTDDEIARRYGDAWQRRRDGASASGAEFAEAGTEGHGPRRALQRYAGPQAMTLADAPQTAMIDAIRAELDKAVAEGEDLASFAERMLALNKLSGVDDLAQILYGAMTTAHLAGLSGEEDSDAGK